MHQRLNDLMVQAGLDGIKPLIPADPQRHLPVERGAFAVRRVCFPLVVAVVHDGEGLFALPLEHHVKAQAFLVQRGLELEGHGRTFDAAGYFRILPVQIILVAYGPEKPGKKPVGNFHAVAVIVQILRYLTRYLRQLGRMFAPLRIAQNMLERDFLPDGGQAGLVLTRTEKGHGKTTRLGIEAEQKIMTPRFRLEGAAEKTAEALTPFLFRLGFLFRLTFRSGNRGYQLLRYRRNVAAGPVESFHAVARAVHALIPKVDGQHRSVGLKVFPLNRGFGRPDFLFLPQSEFPDASFGQYLPPEIGNIFRQRTVNVFLGQVAGGQFLSAIHNNGPLLRGLRLKDPLKQRALNITIIVH